MSKSVGRAVRNARRVKSLSDRMRGAWGMVVIASLTHSAVTVYPYARDIYDAARGMTVTGALPRLDERSDISADAESYRLRTEPEAKTWSASNPVPIPLHPPRIRGLDIRKNNAENS